LPHRGGDTAGPPDPPGGRVPAGRRERQVHVVGAGYVSLGQGEVGWRPATLLLRCPKGRLRRARTESAPEGHLPPGRLPHQGPRFRNRTGVPGWEENAEAL